MTLSGRHRYTSLIFSGAMITRLVASVLRGLLWLLFVVSTATAVAEDDVRCLQAVKATLADPSGRLSSSWNFGNKTKGFVCAFAGVSCWSTQENRVLALSLPQMSLSGTIPSALQYCLSMNTLDLSSNNISGPIPPALCDWVPYITTLSLSSNQLTGPIPSELSNCRYLNTLRLDGNQLSGPIPASLERLDRLTTLTLANNQLSGTIPSSLACYDSSSFAGNPSLCGHPLSSCGRSSYPLVLVDLVAGLIGYVYAILVAYAIYSNCCRREPKPKPKVGSGKVAAAYELEQENDRRWVERLKSTYNREIEVKLFKTPINKLKLGHLIAATGDFLPGHVVTAGSVRMGTSYAAVLSDGSVLTVKRLNGCTLSERKFQAEIGRLGELHHRNLVPLIGYCVAEDERLLVYKHMPNGALSSILHAGTDALDWPARLKITIGAARGLAWLHHGFRSPFIHHHISSNTILIDEELEARITDSGVAELVKQSPESTYTSPFMNGEFGEVGYVAPEYGSNPVATTMGDVYSFGVLLLELLTGEKPARVSSFQGSLVDWIDMLSSAGRVGDAIDRALRGGGHDDEIMQLLTMACRCVVVRPKERPSMKEVYKSLKAMGERYDFLDELDELDERPLVSGQDEAEPMLDNYVINI